ncbi:RNA polymerase sigma factor [Kitasatospora sp. NPDC004289]
MAAAPDRADGAPRAHEPPDAGPSAHPLADPEDFALAYDRFLPDVHRYVAARIGPDAADDVTAEVFLTAFRERLRFDPARGEVRPWLFGIATNHLARHGRAESRRYARMRRGDGAALPRAEDGDARFEDAALAKVAAQRLRPELAGALASLKRADRDVLLLVAVAGLSYAEVAQALGVPAGTVGSRLNRARAAVRRTLGAVLGPALDPKE